MGNLATPTLGGRIHRPTRHLFFRLVQVVGLEFITFIKNPDSVRSKNKVPLKIHSYQNHRNCQINDGIINFAPIRKRPLSTSFRAPGEGQPEVGGSQCQRGALGLINFGTDNKLCHYCIMSCALLFLRQCSCRRVVGINNLIHQSG